MKDFIELYNGLGNNKIEELYMFSCLKASGFNDELGQKLIPLLKDLWLDDTACRCISQLSDNLYAVYEENGISYQLLEIMNVVPGDSLTYHFFVSNFDNITGDKNLVKGLFYPNTNATLSLPIKGEIYNVDCTILYRQVPYDETDTSVPSDGVWNNLIEGKYLDLPQTSIRKVKYEFKVSVVVDDQVQGTTHEDYFNAVLSIKLFVNAASN